MALATILLFVAKALTTLWSKRVQLVRNFQEMASSAGMGRFISHGEEVGHIQALFEERIAMVASAYLYVLTVPCVLSVYGKEIRETQMLDRFFNRWKSYQEWKAIEEKIGTYEYPITDYAILAKDIILSFGFTHLLAFIGTRITQLWEIMQIIIGSLSETIEKMGLDPEGIVNFVNQQAKTYEFKPYLAHLHPWVWRTIHPTLDLDWTVIKTLILLYQTYKEIRLRQEHRLDPSCWLEGQTATLMIDDKPYAISLVSPEGVVEFRVPVDVYDKAVSIDVDSYGVKWKESLKDKEPLPAYDPRPLTYCLFGVLMKDVEEVGLYGEMREHEEMLLDVKIEE